MRELHIRGGWVGINQEVLGFLRQQAKKEDWKIYEDYPDDFPASSGWIKLYMAVPGGLLVEIELRQTGDSNWISLKWNGQDTAEMNALFDHLESRLGSTCPEVKRTA